MPTLAQVHDFAAGAPILLQKFQAARLEVAWAIAAEPTNTPNNAARVLWANKIFADYDADLGKEYRRFLSHPLIQAAGNLTTDANVITAVGSFVNTYTAT